LFLILQFIHPTCGRIVVEFCDCARFANQTQLCTFSMQHIVVRVAWKETRETLEQAKNFNEDFFMLDNCVRRMRLTTAL